MSGREITEVFTRFNIIRSRCPVDITVNRANGLQRQHKASPASLDRLYRAAYHRGAEIRRYGIHRDNWHYFFTRSEAENV